VKEIRQGWSRFITVSPFSLRQLKPISDIVILLPRVRNQGFSLIELLAVLLIIGLSISLISVNVGSNSQQQLRTEAKQFANNTALLAEEAVLANQQWGVDFFREYVDGVERFGYRWLVRNDDWVWLKPDESGGESEFFFSVGVGLRLELESVDREQTIELKQKIVDPTTAPLDIVNERGVIERGQLEPELWLLSSGEMTVFSLFLFDEESGETRVEVVGDELGRVYIETQDAEFDE
jgi:general secretion pathway protein H